MDPQTTGLEQLTPEQDIEVFKKELEQENYEHALFHLACAIGSDPSNQEWLFYADTVFDLLGSSVLEYVELDETVYFATAAMRAYYLWKVKEPGSAVNLLSQVIAAVPEIPYFLWMGRWFLDSECMGMVEEAVIYQFISRNLYQMDRYVAEHGKAILFSLIELFHGFEEPQGQPYMSKYMALSMLYRRVGDMDEALKTALTAYEKVPTAVNATFVALCYKDMAQVDRMKEYTDLSLQLNPKSTAICNDMGDLLLKHNSYKEAAEYYGIAMGEEEDDWAEPSYYYSRYCLKEEDADDMLGLLYEYGKTHPGSRRAGQLIRKVKEEMHPEHSRFYENMPSLEEALVNLLHNISETYEQKYGSPLHVMNVKEAGDFKTTLSCLEAPSAVRALNLYLGDYDSQDTRLQLNCSHCPEPSPLEPVRGSFRLWDYDEAFHFKSRVTPPTEQVSAIVLELALCSYHLTDWHERARELAKKLSSDHKACLYGVMVYPPRCPRKDYYMDWWLERIQFAAVFLLAAMEEREGLIPSPALADICMGQIDWPIMPAMVVLTYQAILYEAVQSTVLSLFHRILDRLYQKEFCFFTVTYLSCVLNLPGVDEETKDTFRNWLRQELSREEE